MLRLLNGHIKSGASSTTTAPDALTKLSFEILEKFGVTNRILRTCSGNQYFSMGYILF